MTKSTVEIGKELLERYSKDEQDPFLVIKKELLQDLIAELENDKHIIGLMVEHREEFEQERDQLKEKLEAAEKELLLSLGFNNRQVIQANNFAERQGLSVPRLLKVALMQYQMKVEPLPEEFKSQVGCGGED